MTQDKCKNSIVMAVLTIVVLAVFWQVHKFEFTNYDDNVYVSNNEHISSGFTLHNIAWLFTRDVGRWHPLVGLTQMLDCELFGLNPGRHHLINLFFHIINTLLLFVVLRKMTTAFWQSVFVAALFALHPMHVEPVAWISGRKDLLCTLFFFLTIAAYFHYVKNHARRWYAIALVLFALGLLAKPMLITLPFILLLLDYWPLQRFQLKIPLRLIWEKIPFFALSIGSTVATFLIQRSIGAVRTTEPIPFAMRVANAVVSYGKYIEKMFWPTHLAVFYPHPGENLPLWQTLAAFVSLMIITILVIRLAKNYKYLFVGWFWYLATLIPVIGLVQIGSHSMADRYSYITLTGLFIIVAWGANDLLGKWKYKHVILELSALAVITILMVLTWFQIGFWHDTFSLFDHALKVTNGNYIAHNNLALALSQHNKFDEALNHLNRSLQINPGHLDTSNHLAMVYIKMGRFSQAEQICLRAIKLDPTAKPAASLYNNLGVIYGTTKRYKEAIQAFRQAIQINPDFAEAHCGLGISHLQTGDKNSAIKEYEILKEIDTEKANMLLQLIHE
jgi:tetratricopeptide (TPR) repeat protein